jgi:hypothetical protein
VIALREQPTTIYENAVPDQPSQGKKRVDILEGTCGYRPYKQELLFRPEYDPPKLNFCPLTDFHDKAATHFWSKPRLTFVIHRIALY